jgi:class 3 adenylate cyclase/tetratricopeptide (TPR) repeat protein
MSELPRGTVTLVFTDLEASTELQRRLGSRYREIADAHMRLLKSAFAEHGGTLVDRQTESFFLAFRRTRDAIRAAAKAQRTLAEHDWPEGAKVKVRMGVHAGEPEVDGDRYLGLAVSRAARICSAAHGGQVLLSSAARALLGDDEQTAVRELGTYRLKDFPAPEPISQLVIEGLPQQFPPLRAPKGTPADASLVGRDGELAQLVDALERSFAGLGRLILLSGEPGIGKSRLADELATEAVRRGARVIWGRCWEAGGAPAYWPWVQALRSLIRDLPPDRLRPAFGPGGAELARMLPDEVGSVFAELPPPAVDPDTDRFRLFQAVMSFLKRAAGDHPIALILDDLHAADASSLLLLRFVADELQDAHVLVVACYRDTELTPGHPLSATVSELARRPLTVRLPLSGLAEADVGRFIALISQREPPAGLAAAVYDGTAGNPLFVGEVAQLLVSEGLLERPAEVVAWQLSVPQGIREVIIRRLAGLSEQTSRLLSLASVLGRDFDLQALEQLSGEPRDELLRLLDGAAAAKLVAEVPGALARFRFSHVLVRDTLYDELPASARVRLHRHIGEALEQRYGHDLDPHLAELAHHFAHAAPAGDVDKAVAYARRAAGRALQQLAYEEAARLFELALQAAGLEAKPDPRVQCELLLGLGDAHARAGEGEVAREAFLHAATVARGLGSGELLARAALGYGGRFVWARAGTDEHLIRLLEDALTGLGDADSSLRVRVMSRLAGALRDEHERETRDALSRKAVEIARRLDDAGALAYALEGRCFAIFWPESATERLEIATELAKIAEQTGDRERLLEARHFGRIGIPLELGDLATVQAERDDVMRLAEELRQPAQRWLVVATNATIAAFEGRFAEAELLMKEAFELGKRAQQIDAVLSYRIQLFTLHLHRGGLQNVESLIRRSVGEYPARPMLRCMHAYLLAAIGRGEEARPLFDELTENRCSVLPVNNEWLFSLGFLVDVANVLRDAERAETLYQLLAPYADRNASTPDYIATGSVSRPLAVAASVVERWSEAENHFGAALRANSEMGAHPWVARTNLDWAEALLKRDAPADCERAADFAGEAGRIARNLGMLVLAARAEAIVKDGVPPAAPMRLRPSLFRREGEYWAIAYEGDAFRLKDSKGLRYLARLLAEPGREVHALDLVAGEHTPERAPRHLDPALVASTPADAGEILDSRAKAEYRHRLSELEEAAEEARALGDVERAARADEERDFLVRELASALGLGGRDRRSASPSERARVSVTRAIRAALARIRKHSARLGDHLDRTVHTGTFCSYMPDPRASVDWRL